MTFETFYETKFNISKPGKMGFHDCRNPEVYNFILTLYFEAKTKRTTVIGNPY